MQEIELSTGDFRASSAFAEGLLACAAHAGNWLQSIRVVQTLPGRQCSPKVVYGDKGTRLEMYRGAQVPVTDGVTCAAHVGLRCSSSHSSRHHRSSSAAPNWALFDGDWLEMHKARRSSGLSDCTVVIVMFEIYALQ